MKLSRMIFVMVALFVSCAIAGSAWANDKLKNKDYDFNCSGTGSGGAPAIGEVGTIHFNKATDAIGSAELTRGIVINFTTFTATFVQGTADPQGNGGNGIPKGCFTATAFFSGDTFGVNDSFFGCFSHNNHAIDWVQTDATAGIVTCHGGLM